MQRIQSGNGIFRSGIIQTNIVVAHRHDALSINLRIGRFESPAGNIQIAPGIALDGEGFALDAVAGADIVAARDVSGDGLIRPGRALLHGQAQSQHQQRFLIAFHLRSSSKGHGLLNMVADRFLPAISDHTRRDAFIERHVPGQKEHRVSNEGHIVAAHLFSTNQLYSFPSTKAIYLFLIEYTIIPAYNDLSSPSSSN